ncbi:radical SAM protein [Candidatus Woesearchaeota archaeon]|jgi:anaerobic magnesium-protoporphyrin IX monomethyl ester cyclase|nr:radical SAM protein [Candidatus Woesearchaeota archaeon]MBT5273093.1 radical SAM protein [Candidatus Woesearchaeota archaeon]MBT6337592.1 radical SAM protein [Candidatus Woesearchaeota archaeon]MBT7927007.1 radical SAM protein [Candidatus Woesearchaeota archaeon]
MKTLFINPPFTSYGRGIKGYGGQSMPINLAYLASFLIENGYTNTNILDAEVLNLSYKEVILHIKKANPDIIGFTSPTPAFQQVVDISQVIKKHFPNIKIIIGGVHPSAMPFSTMDEGCFDYICYGEGEITMLELVKALEKDNPNLSKIDGLIFKKGKKTIQNKPRKLIENLDILPFPARNLLPLKLYYPSPAKSVSEKNGTSIITSRGCPFNCTYCVAKVVWTRRVRFRSAKNVVDEMEECVKRYNLGEFNLHDELFTASEKRVIEICKEILKRKLDVSWVCMARVDTIHSERMLRYMKKAGCGKIVFGFESGSQKVLDLMNKGTTIEQAIKAVRKVKKVNIKSAGSFMLGNIGETRKTMRQTIDFAKKLNTDTTVFFQTSPYPGTQIYYTALKEGYLGKDLKWRDFALLSKNQPALNLPNLPPHVVKKWVRKAYREFYFRPGYLLNQLSCIRSIRDINRMWNGVKLLVQVG